MTIEPDSIIVGDALQVLKTMEDGSVDCVVTSPPYWGLRDYGIDGQIGLEQTPDAFVAELVGVFREVRRVLRDDGTLWLNLGDSYAGSGKGLMGDGTHSKEHGTKQATSRGTLNIVQPTKPDYGDLKPKDLVGIPWRVAFALQADGWYLRQDIIWSKPNPMPESVTDRCTKAHEYIFMLSKSARYHYNADAIRTPAKESSDRIPSGWDTEKGDHHKLNGRYKSNKQRGHSRRHDGFNDRWDSMSREEQMAMGANRRSVWTIATKPYKGAHFATFPPELPELCIKAGCPEGGVVLDPFAGSGTTLAVAKQLRRKYIGIEINPEYAVLARDRLKFPYPML